MALAQAAHLTFFTLKTSVCISSPRSRCPSSHEAVAAANRGASRGHRIIQREAGEHRGTAPVVIEKGLEACRARAEADEIQLKQLQHGADTKTRMEINAESR